MKDITLLELKKLIDSESDYMLIDVRERSELKHGLIPTAKNIPLSELQKAFALNKENFIKKYGFSISKKDKMILYCRTGGRSERAAQYLKNKGFNAYNFKGSILEWSSIDKNVKMY